MVVGVKKVSSATPSMGKAMMKLTRRVKMVQQFIKEEFCWKVRRLRRYLWQKKTLFKDFQGITSQIWPLCHQGMCQSSNFEPAILE